MNVNAISQASGADLLSVYGQNSGGGPAATTAAASAAVLQTAVAEAQISEAQLVGQSVDASIGGQLNVYA